MVNSTNSTVPALSDRTSTSRHSGYYIRNSSTHNLHLLYNYRVRQVFRIRQAFLSRKLSYSFQQVNPSTRPSPKSKSKSPTMEEDSENDHDGPYTLQPRRPRRPSLPRWRPIGRTRTRRTRWPKLGYGHESIGAGISEHAQPYSTSDS